MKVFYLWDFGVAQARDPGFGISVQWDIPMLEGYCHGFVDNRSSDPGNHHFLGYDNPSLAAELKAWGPDVVLLMNYAFLSYFRLLLDPRFWRTPFLFRGSSPVDSHGKSDLSKMHSMSIATYKANSWRH